MPVFIELSLTELIIAERKSKFSEQDTGLFLQSTTFPAYGHLRPSFRGLPVHLASFRPTERYKLTFLARGRHIKDLVLLSLSLGRDAIIPGRDNHYIAVTQHFSGEPTPSFSPPRRGGEKSCRCPAYASSAAQLKKWAHRPKGVRDGWIPSNLFETVFPDIFWFLRRGSFQKKFVANPVQKFAILKDHTVLRNLKIRFPNSTTSDRLCPTQNSDFCKT